MFRRVFSVIVIIFACVVPCHSGCGEGVDVSASADVKGWVVGIVLCMASALCSVIGINFQKRAHMVNAIETSENRKSYLRLPTWWIGIVFVILGAVLDFLSLGFAPQAVVASLGSLTLVLNAAIAPITLGEKLAPKEKIATCVIMVGAVVAITGSSQKKQDYNLEILLCLFREPSFAIYAVVMGVWCVSLLALFLQGEKLLATKDTGHYTAKWQKYHAFSISALSGTLGAQSLLFAKGVSIIVRGLYAPSDRSDGGAAFGNYETYLLIMAMFFFVFSQTHTLNLALKRFDSVVVLPLFQVFWMIIGVFGAGAYFQEFDGMSPLSSGLFALGILVIGAGIYALSGRTAEDLAPQDSDEEFDIVGPHARAILMTSPVFSPRVIGLSRGIDLDIPVLAIDHEHKRVIALATPFGHRRSLQAAALSPTNGRRLPGVGWTRSNTTGAGRRNRSQSDHTPAPLTTDTSGGFKSSARLAVKGPTTAPLVRRVSREDMDATSRTRPEPISPDANGRDTTIS